MATRRRRRTGDGRTTRAPLRSSGPTISSETTAWQRRRKVRGDNLLVTRRASLRAGSCSEQSNKPPDRSSGAADTTLMSQKLVGLAGRVEAEPRSLLLLCRPFCRMHRMFCRESNVACTHGAGFWIMAEGADILFRCRLCVVKKDGGERSENKKPLCTVGDAMQGAVTVRAR